MAEIDRVTQTGILPSQASRNTNGDSSRVVEPVHAVNADKGREPDTSGQKSLGERIRTIRSDRGSDLPSDPRKQAEDFINDLLSDLVSDGFSDRKLRIEEDEASGMFVYQSIDKKSGEVVRQFPPEEILKLITRIRKAEGIVLDESI